MSRALGQIVTRAQFEHARLVERVAGIIHSEHDGGRPMVACVEEVSLALDPAVTCGPPSVPGPGGVMLFHRPGSRQWRDVEATVAAPGVYAEWADAEWLLIHRDLDASLACVVEAQRIAELAEWADR